VYTATVEKIIEILQKLAGVKLNGDVCIEIHFNQGGIQGVKVFQKKYLNP